MPFAYACTFLKHLHGFSAVLQVCAALRQLAQRPTWPTWPFGSLCGVQLASFFTAALQYQFPADGRKYTLAISCSPSQMYAVSCDYTLPYVNCHAMKHITNMVEMDGVVDE